MPSKLQLDKGLNDTIQAVRDEAGETSPLGLSTGQVAVSAAEPNNAALLHLSNGQIVVSNPGNGNVLVTLASERPWILRQARSGKTTALELTAADPDNNNKDFLINTSGRIGIGTTAPEAKLHVADGEVLISNQGNGRVILTLGSERAWVFKQRGTGKDTALELTAADQTNNNKNFLIMTEGRVGIGTRTPQSKLDVEGSITVSEDLVLVRADCAEEFDIDADSETDPGTVMVIGGRRTLRHSAQAYDRRVAGIVSGSASAGPGIVLGHKDGAERNVAIALCGTVSCRVDATAGPVKIGDMLTSSDRPGYAMSAIDRDRSFGAVIGKALGGLGSGAGVVPVLVALQ